MLKLEFVDKNGKTITAQTDRKKLYLPDGREMVIQGTFKGFLQKQFPRSHSLKLIP